jgi:hypothetical protein
VASNQQVAEVVSSALLVNIPPAKDKKRLRSDGDDALDAKGSEPKKCKRFEICCQCDEEYDVSKNKEEACSWHKGRPLHETFERIP